MLTEPEHVWTRPLVTMTAAEREEFENSATPEKLAPWPEVGSRMMTRVLTGQDLRDGWVIVQDGVYRFRVEQYDVMLVRSVLFEYPGLRGPRPARDTSCAPSRGTAVPPHGRYSAQAIAERRQVAALIRAIRGLVEEIDGQD